VVGFTTSDQVVTVAGVDYIPGFDISGLASTESLSVDNLELTILPDDLLPETDLLAGYWNNAAFEVFECNASAPADGVNVIKRGTTGEVQIRRGKYVVEFRSLAQALQQTQGIVTNKTCRARLGDAKCTKDLTAFTVTGTLTTVTSSSVFGDSARAEADDYFAEGLITFTDGPAVGLSQKVKAFATGGFTLSLPLGYTPEVGDAYTAIAGCAKRLEEDCRDKFDNVVNFQGEPHLPGIDALTKPGASTSETSDTPPELPVEGGGGGGD
jgi:uncharacterized phage protein (TIGR02218 family)